MRIKVLGLVLAGGKGSRLHPLTQDRAKPAVPFGGKYRIIDFALSNLVNSGIYAIYVLVQFKSQSLLQHLRDGWQFGGMLTEQFIIPVPAQMRSATEDWYQGTADAVFQNMNLIQQSDPDIVVLFGADHVYRMDVRAMIEFHLARDAALTVAAIPVDRRHASEFGVLEVAADGRILAFHEKRADAPTLPGDPERVLASMGNYVFSRDCLLAMVSSDAARSGSSHDFGKDILPRMVGEAAVYAYDFNTNLIPGEPAGQAPYWRDVGTLDAFFEANMDLRSISPAINLYNQAWPLRTAGYWDPPAKFVFNEEGRRGQAFDSIVSGGCIVSGGTVSGSVLGRYVHVHSQALVEDSVVFDHADVGRGARVRRAILEKNVRVPSGASIGYDPEEDRRRFHVTDSGIVVVAGGARPVPLGAFHI
ncbi:MAG TPA: glucose-1-phosphate adenylyltransferase [Azospirillaceae bacterium]|nr:glucose-1-phosphate adenylyltransferase [Azospirillaceae bacterium]